jgi:hypothetical protein
MVQKGGYCCKYEKFNSNNVNVCPNGGWLSSDVNKINWVGSIQIDATSQEGPLDVRIGYSNHAYKHMEDLEMRCYDADAIRQFLITYIPLMHIGIGGGNFINTHTMKPGTKQSPIRKISSLTREINDNSSLTKYFMENIIGMRQNDGFIGIVNVADKYYKILFNTVLTNAEPNIFVYGVYKVAYSGEGPIDTSNIEYNNTNNDASGDNPAENELPADLDVFAEMTVEQDENARPALGVVSKMTVINDENKPPALGVVSKMTVINDENKPPALGVMRKMNVGNVPDNVFGGRKKSIKNKKKTKKKKRNKGQNTKKRKRKGALRSKH